MAKKSIDKRIKRKVRPRSPAPTGVTKKVTPQWPAAAFVTVAGLILSVRFFLFISRYSVNIFFWDQWDFLRLFFEKKQGFVDLFLLQHGPIREGLGLIADKLLFLFTDWSATAESFMIGGCIFVAMLLALMLKKRLFGNIAYSDVFIPMIFLTLAQYETLIGTPNPGYSAFPLLLIMLYGLALLQRSYLLRYGMVLLLNFLLIYTGFGLFMGVITLGVFALDCYWGLRRVISVPFAAPLAGLLVAAVSLGSFFHGYTFQPAVDCFQFPRHNLAQYPWFVAVMFSTFAGIRSPIVLITILGVVILSFAIFVLGAQMWKLIGGQDRFRHIHLTITVLLAFSLLLSANTAVGRVCLGIPAGAQSSRYATLLIPAFLGMYFYLLTVEFARLRHILLALLIAIVIPGHLHISVGAHWFVNGKRAWAACYKQMEDIGFCDTTTGFPVYPLPERTRLKQKLDYLKQHRLNLFSDPT